MGEGRAKNMASPFHQMPVWGEVVNLNTSGGKNEDFDKNMDFLKNASAFHIKRRSVLPEMPKRFLFTPKG